MITRYDEINSACLRSINQKMPELTLRDLFAMNIINGLCANNLLSTTPIYDFAELAYKQADAMIEARQRK